MSKALKMRISSSSSLKKQNSGGEETDSTMEDISLSDDSEQPIRLLPTVVRNSVTPSPCTLSNIDEGTKIAPCPTPSSFFGGSPVIGILSQPRIKADTEETEYVIAASYVKWLECAGARILPIPWDAPEDMAREIFPQINGLLFPGGNSILPVVARVLWDLANAANAKGEFMPIWGTCLGFEYLLMLASGKHEFVLEGGYKSHDVSWPVMLTEERSDLYDKPTIQNIVTEQPVTLNNHEFGIKPATFASHPGLQDSFRITSVNIDCDGTPFVSTIESRDPDRYPYYGVQYHPEKNAFEYGTEPGTNTPFEKINHSADSIYFSFHLASFFVSLARKNLMLGKVYNAFERFPLLYQSADIQVHSGLKFQQYYLIPAVGRKTKAADGTTFVPYVGKDFSWRLDNYLADHVGIYKTHYTDE